MTRSSLVPLAAVAATTALVAAAVAWTPRGGDEGYGDLPVDCGEVATTFAVLDSEIAELDQRLFNSIEAMGRAAPDEQIEAMQDVITEMAAQRVVIRDKMKAAHQQLTMHFMAHVTLEHFSEGASLADCPLMKSMKPEHKTGGTTKVTEHPHR